MRHINFTDPQYLISGTSRQILAYKTLMELRIFELLRDYYPVLAGTIPINIDIEGRDLDILCSFTSADQFKNDLYSFFGDKENFSIKKMLIHGVETIIADFQTEDFPIEIFGQTTPVNDQAGYRHMVNEHHLLLEYGEDFRREIISLKLAGWKTEPAFAKLLGLKGDPYEEMQRIQLS